MNFQIQRRILSIPGAPFLLKDLKAFSISVILMAVIDSGGFLANWKFFLFLEVKNGIPQGSYLGPFIWNIVMNAFLRKLPSSNWYLAQAYADELVIFIRGRDEEHLQFNLNQVSLFCGNWSRDAGITFSNEKSEFYINQEKHPN